MGNENDFRNALLNNKEALKDATLKAAEIGVFGVPCVRINDSPKFTFFGVDRLAWGLLHMFFLVSFVSFLL